MTDHFIPPLLCPPECGEVFFCAWVLLFLFPVLPLCFFNAVYRLTMATGRGLLVVAVLMSGVRAHCQCIIINLKTI